MNSQRRSISLGRNTTTNLGDDALAKPVTAGLGAVSAPEARGSVTRAPLSSNQKLIADTGGGCSVCGDLPVVNVTGTYWLCGPCVAERIAPDETTACLHDWITDSELRPGMVSVYRAGGRMTLYQFLAVFCIGFAAGGLVVGTILWNH